MHFGLKNAKVISTTYRVPFTLAVLYFHLHLWDIFQAAD